MPLFEFYYRVCVCILSCVSRVQLFATPWTVACQAPLSKGFSRQEYWSRLPCPSPGDPPDPGIKPKFLCLLQIGRWAFFFFFFLPLHHLGSLFYYYFILIQYFDLTNNTLQVIKYLKSIKHHRIK